MKKLLLIFTVCLTFLFHETLSQSQNYSSWEISSGDLSSGKLVMNAGETRIITFSATAVRLLDPAGGANDYLPINFQLQLQRMPSGFSSCGCTAISSVQTITAADFVTDPSLVTKEYTVSVTAAAGASNTGAALHDGDKIIFVVTGPWSPTKSYNVTVTVPPISNNTVASTGNTSFNVSGDPSIVNGSTPTGAIGTYTYQWQSSITSATAGFSNISGATAKSYDPPVIQQTTYYKRIVTSGTLTSTSNVVKITITNFPPISNNVITASGSTSFLTTGDPSIVNGSVPTGGSGTFTYKWQLSTVSATTGFTDIPNATSSSYDPPLLDKTTYYKRIVNSDVLTSSSNAVTITVLRLGATFNNPIAIGSINYCSTYESTLDNSPSNGYGNEYGNSTDDIFYTFNLTTPAKVTLQNCKPDGVAASFYLLNSSGTGVQSTSSYPCDVGSELNFELQPGTYYIVTEGPVGENMHVIPIYLWVSPIVTISSNVTIPAGTSTVLTANGATSYTWSPSTGLSSTTGASVTASPAVTTTYTVQGSMGCGRRDSKTVVVTITGAAGSTMNNPIVVSSIGGCGYTSPELNSTGYGNDYGLPSEDVYYKFTISSASEVDFDASADIPMHFVLLNGSGGLIDQQYYGFVDSGDDAGSYNYEALDGTPLRLTLQAGTYYLVAEGTNSSGNFRVGIQTPAGFSCRKVTEQPVENKEVLTNRIVYPNPANHIVYFNLQFDSPALINIMNSNGIMVQEGLVANASQNIDVSHLPAGLYLIRIAQENKVIREKILIDK